MTKVRDTKLAGRLRRHPWAFSFGAAAVVFLLQLALIMGDTPGQNELPALAPPWTEIVMIPVAFVLNALIVRTLIAAAFFLTTRRRARA